MLRQIPIRSIREDDAPISRKGPSDGSNDGAIEGFVTGVLSGHDDRDETSRSALKNGHI